MAWGAALCRHRDGNKRKGTNVLYCAGADCGYFYMENCGRIPPGNGSGNYLTDCHGCGGSLRCTHYRGGGKLSGKRDKQDNHNGCGALYRMRGVPAGACAVHFSGTDFQTSGY